VHLIVKDGERSWTWSRVVYDSDGYSPIISGYDIEVVIIPTIYIPLIESTVYNKYDCLWGTHELQVYINIYMFYIYD